MAAAGDLSGRPVDIAGKIRGAVGMPECYQQRRQRFRLEPPSCEGDMRRGDVRRAAPACHDVGERHFAQRRFLFVGGGDFSAPYAAAKGDGAPAQQRIEARRGCPIQQARRRQCDGAVQRRIRTGAEIDRAFRFFHRNIGKRKGGGNILHSCGQSDAIMPERDRRTPRGRTQRARDPCRHVGGTGAEGGQGHLCASGGRKGPFPRPAGHGALGVDRDTAKRRVIKPRRNNGLGAEDPARQREIRQAECYGRQAAARQHGVRRAAEILRRALHGQIRQPQCAACRAPHDSGRGQGKAKLAALRFGTNVCRQIQMRQIRHDGIGQYAITGQQGPEFA